jgi:hypothetical protein
MGVCGAIYSVTTTKSTFLCTGGAFVFSALARSRFAMQGQFSFNPFG